MGQRGSGRGPRGQATLPQPRPCPRARAPAVPAETSHGHGHGLYPHPVQCGLGTVPTTHRPVVRAHRGYSLSSISLGRGQNGASEDRGGRPSRIEITQSTTLSCWSHVPPNPNMSLKTFHPSVLMPMGPSFPQELRRSPALSPQARALTWGDRCQKRLQLWHKMK